MDELNSYVDYEKIFDNIVESHLANFPTIESFVNEYYAVEYDDFSEKEKNNIKEFYNILKDIDSFKKQTEGVCRENSIINISESKCEVVFYVDSSTSTESGYDAEYYLWSFEIDTENECIKRYWSGT